MLDRTEATRIPDYLPESVTNPSENCGVEFEYSMSMYYDLKHIQGISGISLGQLVGDFTNLARGATAMAAEPGEGLFRDVGAYDELVTIDHPEFTKDIHWQGRKGRPGNSMQISFVIERELVGKLMEMANERQIDLGELYRRILRMGIAFFRDKEEYAIEYFVRHDGVKNGLGYEFFHLEDEEAG